VAFIVADSVHAAKSAADLIEIEWTSGRAVVDMEAAIQKDSALVWPAFGSNVAFTLGQGNPEQTAAAFERAAHVTRLRVVNNRVVANYMEPRGAIGEYDPETQRYTLTVGTQGGHGMRDVIAKDVLQIDPARLRVITPDVGGGFGTKIFA